VAAVVPTALVYIQIPFETIVFSHVKIADDVETVVLRAQADVVVGEQRYVLALVGLEVGVPAQ
jgi:hypothetical protein